MKLNKEVRYAVIFYVRIDAMRFSDKKTRIVVMIAWMGLVIIALSLYFLKKDILLAEVAKIADLPLLWLGAAYLLLGCLRGITLVPVTFLIILGVVFLPPWTAYILTMAGIIISSTFVYYFSEYLGLADYFGSYTKSDSRVRTR